MGIVSNSLSEEYEKQIRQYLLGKSSFPDNTYIAVYVDHDKDGYPLMLFPTATSKNGFKHHIFHIPGVKFSVLIGSEIGSAKNLFEAYNTNIFFVEYSFQKSKGFKKILDHIKNKIQPKGRLAKEINGV